MVEKTNRPHAFIRSKMGLRNWAWQRVKVVSHPWAPRSTLALIRPLKWGTVCLWTPTGSKNTSRQSWTIEKYVRFSTKSDVFFDRSSLMAGIFGTSGSSETLYTSFERSNQCENGAIKFKGVAPLLLWNKTETEFHVWDCEFRCCERQSIKIV